MGDFNAILSFADKQSPCTKGKRCSLFGGFVDSCELQDLVFSSLAFTWQRGGTFVRLDRALENDAWMTSFPQALVSHLPHVKSDHQPILLSTRPDLNMDKDKWTFASNIADSLNKFTTYVKDWNKDVYGFLGSHKRQLMRELNNIEKALERTDSSFLARKEMEVRDELKNVLNHEDLL
ncbi:hypothetical protein V6Z11_A12G174000 [Gossypium hirsutum]|uniref:Uncharacterized protein n=1 Tax=Gossypium hirsutum TaxID=3635 RepID=A0A1U8LPP3_GOSHI|nr:uncharacterized protein LOC107928672 [Gossypium hirsutum]